jgi:hypothetical protein
MESIFVVMTGGAPEHHGGFLRIRVAKYSGIGITSRMTVKDYFLAMKGIYHDATRTLSFHLSQW